MGSTGTVMYSNIVVDLRYGTVRGPDIGLPLSCFFFYTSSSDVDGQ